MMTIFESLEYLKFGNPKQKIVYQLLNKHNIFTKLAQFTPLLTGTIPINIDTDESDLDIACYWKEKLPFIEVLTTTFNQYAGFTIKQETINTRETILCRFKLDDFKVEIFGQNRPSHEQESYKHMLIESAILNRMGVDFRKKILELKKAGLKTEPAFAQVLGLAGDPYEAMLQLHLD